MLYINVPLKRNTNGAIHQAGRSQKQIMHDYFTGKMRIHSNFEDNKKVLVKLLDLIPRYIFNSYSIVLD